MTIKDKKIWETYTRTVKAAPSGKRKPLVAKTSSEKAAAREAAAKETLQLPKRNASSYPAANNALERKREKSLRRGEIEIDARLDLHGMTQNEAFGALADFMRKKTKSGKRHLLIITGKGSGGAGVLRQNLENWLCQLPESPAILAIRSAAAKHGGTGAFYVLLRKREIR